MASNGIALQRKYDDIEEYIGYLSDIISYA